MTDRNTLGAFGARSIPSQAGAASRRVLVVIGVLLVAFAAYRGWRHFHPAQAADANVYADVQRGDIEDLVSATGALQPRDFVDVGAQVNGQLVKIHVAVGTAVKQGDLLAEIDAEQSTARVEANRAQLRAQAAQLLEREAAVEKAQRDLDRQQKLWEGRLTTLEGVQNAETALRAANAQVNSLKAQMEQVRASMRVEETNLRFTRIYAPMDGTVVSIPAKRGQTLNTNQLAPVILRIADLSTMVVQTQVSEADVPKLRLGMPAYFTTLGGQGRRWYGKLAKIEPTPTVQNNVVLYNALFEVPNEGEQLLPQMTAQVFFVRAEARDVLYVPMSALTMQRRGPGPDAAAPQAPGAAAPPAAAAAPPAGAAAPPVGGEARRGPPPEGRRRGPPGGFGPGGGFGPRGGFGPPPGAGGGPPSGAPMRPRPATVQVAKPDGTLEQREVTLGVSNRVHAEVLSGLQEGERVVAGRKQDEAPRASDGQQQRGGGFGGFGGGPPGAGGFGPPGGFGGR